jgi:uracil-DNA glycosylase
MELSELQKEIKACRLCELDGIDPTPIIWGNANAKVMQISQAPSLNVKNHLMT